MAMHKWFASDEAAPVAPSDRSLTDATCGGGESWLLLAGAQNPPSATGAVRKKGKRGTRAGDYLEGIDMDFRNMSMKTGAGKLWDKFNSMRATKSDAETKIRAFAEHCKGGSKSPVIYYTGHGARGSGDWCFSDSTVSFNDVKSIFKSVGCRSPWLVIDCCFAGHWANVSRAESYGAVLAACPYFMTALDGEDGGDFSLWYCGKNDNPARPPVCSSSGGRSVSMPAKVKTDYGYTDWVSGEAVDGRRVLAQYFHGDKCTLSFGKSSSHTGNGATKWGSQCSLDSCTSFITECYDKKMNVEHISQGSNRFGVYATNGFGTAQVWKVDTWDKIKPWVKQHWDSGKVITSLCSASDYSAGMWAVVMTKMGDEHWLYGSGEQLYRTRSKWSDINSEISAGYNDGYLMTALDKSGDKYCLVMTKATYAQRSHWGPSDGAFPSLSEFWDNNLSITLMFKDDDRWFVVATGGLKDASLQGMRLGCALVSAD